MSDQYTQRGSGICWIRTSEDKNQRSNGTRSREMFSFWSCKQSRKHFQDHSDDLDTKLQSEWLIACTACLCRILIQKKWRRLKRKTDWNDVEFYRAAPISLHAGYVELGIFVKDTLVRKNWVRAPLKIRSWQAFQDTKVTGKWSRCSQGGQ